MTSSAQVGAGPWWGTLSGYDPSDYISFASPAVAADAGAIDMFTGSPGGYFNGDGSGPSWGISFNGYGFYGYSYSPDGHVSGISGGDGSIGDASAWVQSQMPSGGGSSPAAFGLVTASNSVVLVDGNVGNASGKFSPYLLGLLALGLSLGALGWVRARAGLGR